MERSRWKVVGGVVGQEVFVEGMPVIKKGFEPVFAVPILGAAIIQIGGFLADVTRK